MTTATNILEDASILAGVLGVGSTLGSEAKTVYLRFFNQMIDAWDNEGILLGIGDLRATDTVYVDDADIQALTYNFSLTVSRLSRKPVDTDTRQEAIDSKRLMKNKHVNVKDLEIDDRLLCRRYYIVNILNG